MRDLNRTLRRHWNLLAVRNDRGAALAAVMGVMLTVFILTSLVATTVVQGQGFTTMTRAGVSSRSAAEAGLAAAQASLVAGTCGTAAGVTHPSAGVYASATGTTPRFTANIYPKSGSAWSTSPGCPSAATVPVKIVAVGYAEATGVAGADSGDTTTLEAIFSTPAQPTQIIANGPAVYAYSSSGFGGGGHLLSLNGTTPDIMVRNGNVTCAGGSTAAANLVVNGNLTLGGGCGITGTAWASGDATIDGGVNLAGNLRANNVYGKNGTVQGNVQAINNIDTTGGWPTFNGNVTAKKAILPGGVFNKRVWVYTDSSVTNGTYNTVQFVTRTISNKPAWLNIGGLSVTSPAVPATSPYQIPAAPTIPTWIDFGYDASQWVGFVPVSAGTNCSYSNIQALVNSVTGGQPILLDARACSSFTLGSGVNLTVPNDIAIIANKIDLGGGAKITQSGAHRIWLINPDPNLTDGAPTTYSGCSSAMSIGGNFRFVGDPSSNTPLVMLYSPCRVTLASDALFTGQVFASETAIDGGANITYSAVGLPGYDLSTGNSLASSVTETSRRLESVREIG